MSFGYAPQSQRYPQRSSAWPLIVSLLLLIGGLGLFAWQVGWIRWVTPDTDPNAVPRAVTARGDLAADEKSTIELFKTAAPSVVYITTLQNNRFLFNLEQIPSGTGSGFIWDDDGHIVTNAHVIQNANSAKVTLSDGTTLPATLTGGTLDYDLAVLKIDPPGKNAPRITVGTSKGLQVGQKTFAIGNPFGLDHSLTTGVISAIGRQISAPPPSKMVIDNVIQTDAAINPGNSGGPLLDSAGRLIGVNAQIVSPSGAYAGIGFAIPVDTVNQIVTEIIATGKITRPDIGVELADDGVARRWGVSSGALILNIVKEGPADRAGLHPSRRIPGNRIAFGDVITAVDGQPVKGRDEFFKILAKQKVGEIVTLGIRRGKEEVEVKVTLGGG
jgi:S1-C subfamily serine protease